MLERDEQDENRMVHEVWFLVEKDEDGYPESRTWEGLWTKKVGDAYEIASIPFFLKNVSLSDIVSAMKDDFLRFTSVVRHNGHNTYRLLMLNAPQEQIAKAMQELEAMKLSVELHENGVLLAVDVPPSVDQRAIDAYLLSNKEKGLWSVQDGYLASQFD